MNMQCFCEHGRADRHDYMKVALEEIRWLLSPQKNDGYSEATRESNTNEAWMRAYVTLKSLEEGRLNKLGPAPTYEESDTAVTPAKRAPTENVDDGAS